MKRILLILALCLCAILFGCSVEPEETVPPLAVDWIVNYNPRDPYNSNCALTGEQKLKDLKLTKHQLKGIIPKNAPGWMKASGYRQIVWLKQTEGPFEKKFLNFVELTLTTTMPDENITLIIQYQPNFNDDYGAKEDQSSMCNGIEYWVYEDVYSSVNALWAKAWIGDYWYSFSIAVEEKQVEQAKADLKAVLESFTYYAQPGMPDLSAIEP